VKRFAFAILSLSAILSSPAAGQALANAGSDFVHAVKERDGDKANQVLSSHTQGIVDAKDEQGNTGLIIAISRSDEDWTGFLLNHGADPNLPGKGGDTPLIAATRVGFGQAVEWLLALGAKVDASNRMRETPLIIAVQQRNMPLAKLFLSQGADPDKSDAAAGYSARDYAERDPRARDILNLINQKKPKSSAGAK
jgi:ankyrin repeat protein